jgi:hypothetical protein
MTTTAQTMSGTPVASLATEWGTFTVITGGVERVYPAARTERGILRAQKVEGSATWIAARRGEFKAQA